MDEQQSKSGFSILCAARFANLNRPSFRWSAYLSARVGDYVRVNGACPSSEKGGVSPKEVSEVADRPVQKCINEKRTLGNNRFTWSNTSELNVMLTCIWKGTWKKLFRTNEYGKHWVS